MKNHSQNTEPVRGIEHDYTLFFIGKGQCSSYEGVIYVNFGEVGRPDSLKIYIRSAPQFGIEKPLRYRKSFYHDF